MTRRWIGFALSISGLLTLFVASVRAQDEEFKTAFQAYQAGRIEQATAILESVVRAGRGSALDFSLLGRIRLLQADYKAAERDLKRSLELEPGLLGARSVLASVYENEGNAEKAVEELRRVLAGNPQNSEVLLALGRLESKAKNLNEAAIHLEHAAALKPADIQPLLALAHVRNLQGNSEAALALVLRAKKIAPQSPIALYAVGVLCLQMDLQKDALENLESAVAIDPTPANLYALASAQLAQRDFPAAIKIYTNLLQSNPNDPQLNYALGAAYFLANEDDLAQPAFERSIAAQPNQVESQYYLALLAGRHGDQQKSIGILQDVIQRQPDHARAHLALGLALRSTGRLEAARAELETAVRLDPQSQKAHYQLGLILASLKKEDEAKGQLEIASRLRSSSDDKVRWELVPAGQEQHAR